MLMFRRRLSDNINQALVDVGYWQNKRCVDVDTETKSLVLSISLAQQ